MTVKVPIPHKHYLDAQIELRKALEDHRPGRLIGICALAGGGKTFLRNHEIRAVLGPPESWGTGKVAAIEVMALLDFNSKLLPKGFAARAHRAVLTPDFRGLYRDTDDKIQSAYLESLLLAERSWERSRARSSTTESEYWASFMEASISRGIKFILVEHADAFGTLRDGEEPTDHMQNLMSVTEAIGAMAVLNYVPGGYKLWLGNSEVADRMDRIFIHPYDPSDDEQMNSFAFLVTGVAERYPFESPTVYQDLVVPIAISTGTSTRAMEQLFRRAEGAAEKCGRTLIRAEDVIVSFETKEHVESVWKQVRLLKEISRPATCAELLEVHRQYLKR